MVATISLSYDCFSILIRALKIGSSIFSDFLKWKIISSKNKIMIICFSLAAEKSTMALWWRTVVLRYSKRVAHCSVTRLSLPLVHSRVCIAEVHEWTARHCLLLVIALEPRSTTVVFSFPRWLRARSACPPRRHSFSWQPWCTLLQSEGRRTVWSWGTRWSPLRRYVRERDGAQHAVTGWCDRYQTDRARTYRLWHAGARRV